MKYIHLIGLSFLMIMATFVCNAQTYTFHHNARGHRDSRTLLVLKSATIPADSLLAKELKKPLDDQIGLQKTRIYPNPTKGLLLIDFPALIDQEAMIRVYDPNGRLIVQKAATSSGNEVDLSAHPPGFYIMVIHIGLEKKEWKIIKE